MGKSGLVSFAEDEFKILGWDKSDDEMQKEICKDLIELLTVLSKQGHSGFSMNYILSLPTSTVKLLPSGRGYKVRCR